MKKEVKYKCRGFACMPVSQRRKISKLGAVALHEQGKAHKFTSKTAKKAVKKRFDL